MDNIFFIQLSEELKKQGISGNKLCNILGIANANYSNWKKGTPKAEIICKIADVLNVSTDYLLGRSETDPDLPEDEKNLLANYRKADDRGKKRIQRAAEDEAQEQEQKIKANVS